MASQTPGLHTNAVTKPGTALKCRGGAYDAGVTLKPRLESLISLTTEFAPDYAPLSYLISKSRPIGLSACCEQKSPISLAEL